MENLLKDYKDFVSQFEMVGSNVVYLSKDGYLEQVNSGNSYLEGSKDLNNNSIYRIASIQKLLLLLDY